MFTFNFPSGVFVHYFSQPAAQDLRRKLIFTLGGVKKAAVRHRTHVGRLTCWFYHPPSRSPPSPAPPFASSVSQRAAAPSGNTERNNERFSLRNFCSNLSHHIFDTSRMVWRKSVEKTEALSTPQRSLPLGRLSCCLGESAALAGRGVERFQRNLDPPARSLRP